jgi:hypothetical protein
MAVVKKLTGEELLALLKKKWLENENKEQNDDGEDYDEQEEFNEKMEAFAYSGRYITSEEIDPEIGEFEEVAKYGGVDKGSTWYSVKHFKDHDVYIRVDGYYTSYDGVSFDSWEDCVSVVEPKQKTIIEYV